jgi:hypothetical protein
MNHKINLAVMDEMVETAYVLAYVHNKTQQQVEAEFSECFQEYAVGSVGHC